MGDFAYIASSDMSLNGPVQLERAAPNQPMTLAELNRWFNLSGNDNIGGARAYSKVGIVMACVRHNANQIASMPLRASDATDQVVETGPIAELVQRPSKSMTRRAFWRAMSAFIDLFGRAYIVRVLAGRQVSSYTVKSEIEIDEVKDGGGQITHYMYRPHGTGTEIRLELEEVYRIVDPNYGLGTIDEPLSPRQAVGLAIRQHYKADVANESSLDHGASGGMGLRSDKNLTEPQRKSLKEDLEAKHSGTRGRHRWVLLEGLSVERLFSTFNEMEFAELKRMSRDDICVGFGVHPLVLGFTPVEGQATNLDDAMEITWTLNLIPRAEWFSEEFTEAILQPYDQDKSLSLRDASRRKMALREVAQRTFREQRTRALALGHAYYAWFDSSAIPAMQRGALKLIDQIKKLVDMGVPLNSIIETYDLPFEQPAWGNTWYKPYNLQPVDEPMPGTNDPQPDAPDATPDEPQQDKSLQIANREITDDQLNAMHQSWRLSWAPLERSLNNTLRRVIMELRGQTLKRLNEINPGRPEVDRSVVNRDVVDQIIFDLVNANELLLGKVTPLMVDMIRLGGTQTLAEDAVAAGGEAADAPAFDMSEQAQVELRKSQVSITRMNRTTQRRLREQLADAIANEETTAQMAERIRKEFNLANSRARSIAYTETSKAVEAGRAEGRRQANVPGKSWLWSRQEHGRQEHAATEAETLRNPIDNDQDFTIVGTGITAPYPRASGVASQDINCGCSTLNRYPGDNIKDARMIGHLMARGFVDHAWMVKHYDDNKEA